MTPVLDTLCDLIVDCEHKTAPPAEGGEYPLIRTPDIGLGRLLVEKAQRVTAETYRAWTKRAVPRPGDLILAREAPVGNVGIVRDGIEPVLGQRTVLIRPDASRLDPLYLNYLLSGPVMRGWMEGVSIGATVPHLNMADIRSMELPPLPPLPTQRKIAAILGAYDDLIENTTRRITLLEEMAQRLYREWFSTLRYPGHENVPLVDSDLGPIPQGWEVRTLDDVCSRITDGAHASPPSTAVGRPMASVKDMADFSLDIGGCRMISPEDYATLCRQGCQPRAGDVLISKDGAKYLDKVVPIYADQDVVLLSSIALLRPNGGITPDVLTAALKDADTKRRLKGHVSGAAIPRVVLKDFKIFRLVLPPRELQRRFDEAGGAMRRTAASMETIKRTLRTTRDLLLPRLISGEVAVEKLDIHVPNAA